ncbi:5'-3' exonuclease PLD3-like isoform X2 [Centruroides vittatus]|uniref:5'-3' exonuclease PLD3-like isoform X2 n=1 Tax=Centruroides vittatus TaxID=120091 RepID=UPI00350EDCB5
MYYDECSISRSSDLTAIESRGKLDIAEFELQHFDYRYMVKSEEAEDKWNGWLKPSCIPITIILILIILVVILPLLDDKDAQKKKGSKDVSYGGWNNCSDSCFLTIVENVPKDLKNLSLSPLHNSITSGLQDLLEKAQKSLDIVTTNWNLPSASLEENVNKLYEELERAVNEKGVQFRIVRNDPFVSSNNQNDLFNSGNVEIRNIDLGRLQGSGSVTSQLWIVDDLHLYIGSSSLDWMTIGQMKDIGVIIYNCSCLAEDLQKIFQLYWTLAGPDVKIPSDWPSSLETTINKEVPLSVNINDTFTQIYFSNSPNILCPKGRSSNVDSVIDIISKAKHYIYISVMDYIPAMCINKNIHYWSAFDEALRKAAVEKKISVKILATYWKNTHPSMIYFLKSLAVLNSSMIHIDVKLFQFPSNTKISMSLNRVNRNSFVVTDNDVYLSTFGWSGDSFLNTAGLGMIINQSQNDTTKYQPIRQQFQTIFLRDWMSVYAHPLSDFG